MMIIYNSESGRPLEGEIFIVHFLLKVAVQQGKYHSIKKTPERVLETSGKFGWFQFLGLTIP